MSGFGENQSRTRLFISGSIPDPAEQKDDDQPLPERIFDGDLARVGHGVAALSVAVISL